MIFVALHESASKGELLLVDDGMCRFHRRRDGSVTVREILVLPHRQRKGIGRAMLTEVLARANGHIVRARCPLSCESGNAFWAKMGFTLIDTARQINTWQRPRNQ